MTPHNRRAPFTKRFLKEMRDRLLAARRRAEAELDDLQDLALTPTWNESALEEPADVGSEEYAQEINLDLLEKESDFLTLVDQALARIDESGDRAFGRCEACEDNPKRLCPTCPWIPEERLRNSPWVRNCAEAQAEIERQTESS